MHPVYSQVLSSYSLYDEVDMLQAGGHEFKLACRYEYQQCYLRAQFWYQTGAKKGHCQAQNNLAVMYALGRVELAAPVNALDWFLKAAEQGDEKAKRNLNCLQLDSDPLGNPHFVI
jgi:TPR repeat protein|tara:strand:+ start:1294 stop:1641 length:348 start_codon:yes stop_codon:yes gene_type:complete